MASLPYLLVLVVLADARSCNEAKCASLVSKCLLIEACKCECADAAAGANDIAIGGATARNCSCARNCYQCLDALFADCCDCVNMCPQSSDDDDEEDVEQTSQVGDLPTPFPDLFDVLTQDEDPTLRWTSAVHPETANNNCTVVFMSQCTSMTKCRHSCQSMGSSKFRWFHDGCCQCIGADCLGFGVSASRCFDCSSSASLADGTAERRRQSVAAKKSAAVLYGRDGD